MKIDKIYILDALLQNIFRSATLPQSIPRTHTLCPCPLLMLFIQFIQNQPYPSLPCESA